MWKQYTYPQPVGGTFLSRRGYALLKKGNEVLIDQLKQDLTVKPNVNPNMPNADEVTPFPLFLESSKKLYIPKYFGLQSFGVPTHDELEQGDLIDIKFNGLLRKEQEIPIQSFVAAMNDKRRMGGILSLFCGGGKTVLGLYLISLIQRKTLIIFHKDFLCHQWKERISTFLPNARIGILKQSKVEVDNVDIVLASLQSLAMRDYPLSTFATFGMVIIDECHHLGAEVFCRALPKVTSRVMLGLSATLRRKDGMSKVFTSFLGDAVFEQKKRQDTSMNVIMRSFYDPNPEYGRERSFRSGGKTILNVAQMVNAICSFQPRNDLIIQIIQEIVQKEPNRRLLILSERRTHLKKLEAMIAERNIGSTGYYVGGMTQEQLSQSESKQIILATYQMSSEGMDIPVLNTLILASPISSIEQSIGRIQRQKEHEREYIPMTIDIWDRFSLFQRQGMKRMEFYAKQGYVTENTGGIPVVLPMNQTSKEKESEKKMCYRDDDDNDV